LAECKPGRTNTNTRKKKAAPLAEVKPGTVFWMNGLGLNPRPTETRFEMKKPNLKPKNDSFSFLGLAPQFFFANTNDTKSASFEFQNRLVFNWFWI